MSTMASRCLKKALYLVALTFVALASGCAATTTAGVQATMHSDATYRFQSSDLMASVQVVFVRQ